MRGWILVGVLALVAADAMVIAQGGPPPDPRRGAGPGMRGGPPLGPGIDVIGVEPIEFGKPVTGAPFSAEAVTEVMRSLPDGNRIERMSTSMIARDRSGRTRRDQTLPSLGPIPVEPEQRIVTINDPTQRVLYFLDPVRKTATKAGQPPPPPTRTGEGPQGPPRAAGPDMPRPPRPDITSTRLGTREIAGLQAEGTRERMTIPAGAFGNLRPIEIVTDRWFSPDLKIVVESRRSDPLSGEVHYSLRNLVRAEPEPDLFQVPAEYSIVDRPLSTSPVPPRR